MALERRRSRGDLEGSAPGPEAERFGRRPRSELKRRPWPDRGRPQPESPSEGTAEVEGGAEPVEAEPVGQPVEQPVEQLSGQALLDAQRGYRPEVAAELRPGLSGQALLDAQRGYRPETVPEVQTGLSGQALLDAQRGYQPEVVPEAHLELSGQALLDAQRGYQPTAERPSRPGPKRRSRLESKQRRTRPYQDEDELRSRPEPRWARNDPERPIGYDPERWAGFAPGDLADLPGPVPSSEPGEPVQTELFPGGPGSAGESGSRPRKKGFGAGKRGGLGSGRRSDRPKKPRPDRSPEEKAQRSAQRRERAAADVAADPAAAARSIVLRQLTMGPRTRAQLRAAMARKEIPEDVATAVLDRFEEVNLVDDEEFARQWVQSRHLGRGLAPRALAYELRQRGIADETVKGAVEEVTPEDELAAARELVRRKAAGMRDDDPQRRIRRLAGMLARKGYGGGVAMRAIREELADLAEQADLAELGFADDEL